VDEESAAQQDNRNIRADQYGEYVAVAAYYLYLEREQALVDGTPEEDWLAAQKQIDSSFAIASSVPIKRSA
jgi:hypothetical protein